MDNTTTPKKRQKSKIDIPQQTSAGADASPEAEQGQSIRNINLSVNDISLLVDRMRTIHTAAIAYIDGSEDDAGKVKTNLETFLDCQKKYADDIAALVAGIFDDLFILRSFGRSEGGAA